MYRELNLDSYSQEIKEAVKEEIPKLEDMRRLFKNLKVQELGYRPCYAIAPVATDGGENRLTLEPMNIEILRVVDSEGRERIQKIVPLTSDPKIFKNLFEKMDILSRFLQKLSISYEDISYFLPTEKKANEEINIRGAVRTFRDIVEWAVLLDMAWEPERTKILLIRDGLLRSKSMKENTVNKLAESFKKAYEEKGSLLVGVAKKARVLSYYSLAMTLEGTFDRSYPCFCEIPEEVERVSYNYAASWLGKRNFGDLYFVKLTENPRGLILPVEIPSWLRSRRKEILEYLAETAKVSFPVIGYPDPLIKAHENAVLNGLEMEILASKLINEIIDCLNEMDHEKVRYHLIFGRGLTKAGAKNYD